MRTLERERHRLEMKAAAEELALEAVVSWSTPFSYQDVADYIRAGLRDLGYDPRANECRPHDWGAAMVRGWVKDGSVVVVRDHRGPAPKLFQLAGAP